jgi:divalent metal cation (Fe/Co/Zn/Cd) transporter
MKKRQERIINFAVGIILMGAGLVAIIYGFFSLFVLHRISNSMTELLETFIVPLGLIYFGYYIFRGKEIPLPQIAAK